MLIRGVGIDAAFTNMGFARVDIRIDADTKKTEVICTGLQLVTTQSHEGKTVRKSSIELRRAKELQAAMITYCQGAQLVFVEVPSGSQSASAARALGIAVGVLASCPLPIIEVSPMEVKFAVSKSKKINPTKAQVIQWAVKHWPQAPWLRDRGKTGGRIVLANEHLADAMATVMAGINTPDFQRLMTLSNHHAIPLPNHERPSPDRSPRRRVSLGSVPVAR